MTRGLPAGLLAAALLLASCASAPAEGPVERPDIYPDRSSAAAAWRTFLWAWKAGDVDVLLEVTGWKMRGRLEKELEANGREAVAAWYRRDAQDLVVREGEWTVRGEALAYLRVVLTSSSPEVPRVEVDFAFVRRPDGWVVTERRPVR